MAAVGFFVLAVAQLAAAQLPNLRVGLPEDVDANKRLDVQAGYSLKVSAYKLSNQAFTQGCVNRKPQRCANGAAVAPNRRPCPPPFPFNA